MVGTPFTWSITVTNIGGASGLISAGEPVLTDTLPDSDMTYGTPAITSSSGITNLPTCTIVAATQTLRCNGHASGTTFAPGSSLTVAFAATPTAAATFANPRSGGACLADPLDDVLDADRSNNVCSDTVSVTPEAALTLTKSDAPDPATAGAPLTFTLDVANAGPSPAAGATVYDVLPAGTAFDAAASDSSCSQPAGLVGLLASLDGAGVASGLATLVLDTATNRLRFALATVDVSDTITGASLRTPAGVLVQTLYAGAPPAFGNSQPIAGVLQLSQAEADALLVAGAHVVRIDTDASPAGAIAGTLAVAAEAPVRCDLGTVAASGNVGVDVVTTIDAGLGTARLRNLALVDATTDDPDETTLPAGSLRGAAALSTTTVSAAADLTVAKADDADPVIAGTDLTYTLTVTNLGPSVSTGSSIADVLPAGTTFVSSADGCQVVGSGIVACPIGGLAPGASAMASFTVAVGAQVVGTLTNRATVSGNEIDPVGGNDEATETTAVQASADLGLAKSAAPDPVTAGTDLTYTLTVTNLGPSASTGATVSDPAARRHHLRVVGGWLQRGWRHRDPARSAPWRCRRAPPHGSSSRSAAASPPRSATRRPWWATRPTRYRATTPAPPRPP